MKYMPLLNRSAVRDVMTTWNFRIIKHDTPAETEVWFGLHEVYYEDGEIDCWTEKPILVGDSFEDIAKEVDHIFHDLKSYPEAISLTEVGEGRKKKKDG